jgi:O-antigen ligase
MPDSWARVDVRPAQAPAEVWAPGWDILLACVATYIGTAVGRVQDLFPALSALKLTLLSALLAVVLFVLQQGGRRQVGGLRSTTTTCVLGILVWSVLSVPGALSPGFAFHYLFDFCVKTIVMFLVIAGAVRTFRDVERLALVYFVATATYAAVVLFRFQLGSGDDWRLGHLYDYDANDFATLIATAMPLGLYFVLARRSLVTRVLAVAGLIVLLIGEIRSGSRGGFLALIAVTLFVLFRFSAIRARARVAALAVILVVLVATSSDRYWEQMQTVLNPHEDYNATSETGRLKIWGRGMTYLADHPVLGVGVGNFPVAEGTLSPMAGRAAYGVGVRWGAAHNSFVQVGAELGVPGLLFLLGALGTALATLRGISRDARWARKSAIGIPRLAESLSASLVGFAVGGFFLSLAYSDMLYTLVALAVGLAKVTRVDFRVATIRLKGSETM